MATNIEPTLIAFAGTLIGGMMTFSVSAWVEWRRARETWEFRNHAERARTATAWIVAFDTYRRAIRDDRQSADQERRDLAARELADTANRMRLYFSNAICKDAELAGDILNEMRRPQKETPADIESEAEQARDELIGRMRLWLGEPSIVGGHASEADKRVGTLRVKTKHLQ